MDEELKNYLDGMKRDMRELREHVTIECEKVETKRLTEFHKQASPSEARAKSHAAALRAMDLELEALSERVTKLEPTH